VVAVCLLSASRALAAAGTFGYGSLLSAPLTLGAFVQSIAANGTVVVNGGDSEQPSTPFKFSWGDGSSTTGFFGQQHTYANTGQNYVVTITAYENSGATQQIQIPVFFVGPSISPQATPQAVTFDIPSHPIQFGTHYSSYALPSGETVFPDGAFTPYSRGNLEYLLTQAAAIAEDFANDNVYLLNGIFDIEMIENVSFGGGYCFWFTTPMSVGYGSDIFSPAVQWYVVFNEIGKDTALNTPTSLPFGGNTDGNASQIYSETMGDIFSYAIGYELVNNATSYGIGNDVVVDMSNDLLAGAADLKGQSDAYVAAGAPFSSWEPDGVPCATLAWKFIEHAELQGLGYRTPTKRLMRLLQMFNPSMLASYDPQHNTQAGATYRSTLMVTALSYAFSEDLRSEFRALNFPIDDAVYAQLYNQAGQPASISLSTSQANFTYTIGGAAPPPQSISISNSGSGTLAWSASSNASWLSATPSGTAPSTLTISVTPTSLTPGSYNGAITVTATGASNSPVSISVTLRVAPAPASLVVSPQALTFNYTVGAAVPASQGVSITNTGGGTLSWTASADSAWVVLSPLSGTGPATLSVSVNPATLSAGTFPATVKIAATGATGSPVSVSVTLVVQAPQPTVSITAVDNGASFQAGFASATWVSIFGTSLSQATRTWQNSDFVNGLLPTSLGVVSVTVNGMAAYVGYISPTQVNVLAPDDATVGAVQVQVTTAQGKSNSLTAQKEQFAPAFFTMGGSYVAAQHADYTYVGKPGLIAGVTTQPAKPGETIILYGTGFGPTNPPLPSAQLVTTPAVLANSVQVTIGGVAVQPQIYAGLVEAGLYQFNVTVPNVPDGDAAVVAQIGGVQTQTGVLITIQQ
jgi:uncharacterized protein (TIGR03437 family)